VLFFEKGQYSVVPDKLDGAQALVAELAALRKKQDALLAKLISYVEAERGPLIDARRALLTKCFCEYIFDSEKSNQFSADISSFIVRNQNELDLTEHLNAVREGFVLYDGVRHTADLNKIGMWQDGLVVYLDTEHLFNAVGAYSTLNPPTIPVKTPQAFQSKSATDSSSKPATQSN
jgi:hypothetical protein